MTKDRKLKAAGEPLASYVSSVDEKLTVKTIRGPVPLWERVQALADRHGTSLNQIVLLALEKVCDEEGL